jgi:hypothetical protein
MPAMDAIIQMEKLASEGRLSGFVWTPKNSIRASTNMSQSFRKRALEKGLVW